MRKLKILARTSLLALLFALASFANTRWIVQTTNPGSVNTVAQQFGATILASLHNSDGIYAISLPAGALGNFIAQLLKASPLVQSVEPDTTLGLPETSSSYNPNGHMVPGLATYTGNLTLPDRVAPWGPYLNQPANLIVRLAAAQQKFGYGGGLIAVIDTGVDYTHPVLFPVTNFWQAKDFTGNDPTGNSDLTQETSPMVDQETSPMVDGSGTIILNQETSPMVDQETSPMVDAPQLPADFGHGTMVAGIIHLVAPAARILPIKAFSSDGTGDLSNVIQAIYYAVDQGATVINASWSTLQSSQQLQKAMDYAHSRGVVVVAAVANNGQPEMVYPAANNNVIGTASTNNQDYRSSFSDYGSDVDLAAPGEAILTTFPRNRYALGWGTSFATPYVAGTVALIQSLKPHTNSNQAVNDLNKGADPAHSPGLGAGRLDVYGAAAAAH